jgi:hypothetical protein
MGLLTSVPASMNIAPLECSSLGASVPPSTSIFFVTYVQMSGLVVLRAMRLSTFSAAKEMWFCRFALISAVVRRLSILVTPHSRAMRPSAMTFMNAKVAPTHGLYLELYS